jgi:protein-L-isoaspartate(D-aspartate) O-methyltransferase
MDDEIAARRWYAEDLRLRAPIARNMAIVAAFAAVPRQRFAGAGPWRLLSDRRLDHAFTTPDDDPRWLDHDVLVTVDQARGLNIGLPSLWAASFDQLDLRQDERILQVGAGTGYYAAVLAEIVGPQGRVVAIEVDEALAARARANLAPWPQVEAVHGDGRTHDPGEVDVIIVFAGATHPAPLWLDRLAPGGQLLMPLTGENRWGFMLPATRLPSDDFAADSIGPVGIFPCVGGRDEAAAKRLTEALTRQRGSWFAEVPIVALHRGEPRGDEADRVWYGGPGFWLERKMQVEM